MRFWFCVFLLLLVVVVETLGNIVKDEDSHIRQKRQYLGYPYGAAMGYPYSYGYGYNPYMIPRPMPPPFYGGYGMSPYGFYG